MFDFLYEILATIRKNKMRTFLTGFAVAWGIFMLIILLAAGNGLKNGAMANFSRQAMNTVTVSPGWTSVPYGGYRAGRRILFDQRDLDLIKSQIPNLEYVSASRGRNLTLTYGEEYGSWRTEGVASDGQYINNLLIPEGQGRFINEMDVEKQRKVIVISNNIQTALFGEKDPIGEYVKVGNIAFRVVGIYQDENRREEAYIPFTTAQMLYFPGRGVSRLQFTVTGLETLEENQAFNDRVRNMMAAFHRFDPADRSALYVYNNGEDAIQFNQLFSIINLFVLAIGVASLMAGIVGVGNIMLITVKERTREIGIRKAIGATTGSILKLIIFEAIFITTVAGYIGILIGIGITELVSSAIFNGSNDSEFNFFANPTVDLGTVIGATVFLIGCGVVAGLIPALKATRVRPIEAMRAE